MKKTLIIFFLSIKSLFAIEVKCNFEEVYQNGDVQQGIFLLKGKALRYQYYDEDLYTIIAKNNYYYLVNNFNTKTVHKATENTELIANFIEISSDFPNIKNQYHKDGFKVKIEKSHKKFIKRISIQSDKINLSINLINCTFDNIDKKYFRPFNFEEYKR